MTQEEYNDQPSKYYTELVKPLTDTRPEYYGGKDSVYEVFNVLEAWNLDKDFYLGNVIKYIRRCELKMTDFAQARNGFTILRAAARGDS